MRAPRAVADALRASAGRFRGAPRSVHIAVLTLVITTVGYAIALAGVSGPEVLLWLPVVASSVNVLVAFVRTYRVANLPASTRRFWRHLTIVAVLVSGGCINQAIETVRHPGLPGPPMNPAVLACLGGAILMVVFGLQRLPLREQTRGEVLRVGLDGGTIMVASGVYAWYFMTRSLDPSAGILVTVSYLLLTILVSVAVLAMAKVVISSSSALDKSVLRLLAFCMGIGSVFSQVFDFLAPRLDLTGAQVTNPAAFLLAVLAAERQRAVALHPRSAAPLARRRPFSVLPYIAVAAVDVLLIAVTWSASAAERMLVMAAVGLTTLVVMRQMTAFRDNTRLLAELDHTATHDALTQLPNRALFGERLEAALTGPDDRPVQVALIDLDGFKEVNDTLGHEVGDLLLVTVARRLSGCMRVQDTVARLGGDEFVVVLDGADRAAADAVAKRIIDVFHPPVLTGGHELSIMCSIGIAGGHTGDEPSMVMRHADTAMYAAKNLPGTAYLHHDDVRATTGADRADLGAELGQAIVDRQLVLYYQPVVSLPDGRLRGAEALLRWKHPILGVLDPPLILPIAERTGLIMEIDRWVLREALRQFAAWITTHGDAAPTTLSVNISARDLRQPTFTGYVAALLDEFDVAPQRLVLELTETVIAESGAPMTSLKQLRTLGVRLCLDDFGTGRSALGLLHDCPIDEIKLDRSFVRADRDDHPTMAVTALHLADLLDVDAVAKGIETIEHADTMHALGYTTGQGNLFARPMPAADLDDILSSPGAVSLTAPL